MVVDGDGQHTMADAPLFLEAIDQGADVVFCWKKVRHDPAARLILSRGLRVLSHWVLGSPLHDINAGCRAFRKDVARRIEIKHRINFVGDEIYARCRIAGWKVAEVDRAALPARGGASRSTGPSRCSGRSRGSSGTSSICGGRCSRADALQAPGGRRTR